MVNLGLFVYFTIYGVVSTLLFFQSRCSRRRTVLIISGLLAVLLAADILIYRTWGAERLMQVYTLVNHVPVVAVLVFLSRNRGWQLVFLLLSTVLFCFSIHHAATLAYVLSGREFWAQVLAYVALTPATLMILVYYLRPLYFRVLPQIQRGVWLLCLIMAGYYFINIYLVPGFAGVSMAATVIKPALSLLMVGVYVVFLYLFASVQREEESRRSAELFSMQLSAFQRRIDAVHAAEEQLRMERHDLRHRLQTAAELMRQGKTPEALDFIGAAQRRLDETKPVQWCRPPVLDAVFSSYFNQARQRGVRVEAEIALPDGLPMDEGELAIVFANALENAVNACMALPAEQRVLRCKVICIPKLMFEIANPCAHPVCLDENGLPVSGQKGHGIGTRSIAAFCRKYGALYQYEQTDGWFSLRVIL